MNTSPTTLEPSTSSAIDTDTGACTRTHTAPGDAFSGFAPLVAEPDAPVQRDHIIARPTEPPDRTRATQGPSLVRRLADAFLDLVDLSTTPSHRAITAADGGYRSPRG
ncbi:hypothetical protein [Ilumatobacter nonamiensis]|uniref:hypothetical protein n=1 Tax=Ilumatobacter nonamiensis TaxID=467093 RepID=UPI00034C110D|nr:hypothetical protein [Ilumatobacter nonamiensis]